MIPGAPVCSYNGRRVNTRLSAMVAVILIYISCLFFVKIGIKGVEVFAVKAFCC